MSLKLGPLAWTSRHLTARHIIPTALRTDRGPRACGDGSDTRWIVGEEVPSFAGFVDDVVVIIEHGDGELVCA
jgi:hypothetical protein